MRGLEARWCEDGVDLVCGVVEYYGCWLVLRLDGFPWVDHEPSGGLVTGKLTHADAVAWLGRCVCVWGGILLSRGVEGRIPVGGTRETGFVVAV